MVTVPPVAAAQPVSALEAKVLVIAVPVFVALGLFAWYVTPPHLKSVARIVTPVGMTGAYLVWCAAILSERLLYFPGVAMVAAAPLLYYRLITSRQSGDSKRGEPEK